MAPIDSRFRPIIAAASADRAERGDEQHEREAEHEHEHERRPARPAGRRSRRPPPTGRSRAPSAPGPTRAAVGATRSRSAATVSLHGVVGPVGHRHGDDRGARVARPSSTRTWPRPPVTSSARSPSALQRRAAAPARRARVPRTTSCASSGAPGNARSIAASVCATGSPDGSSVSPVLSCSAGSGERAEHADGGDQPRRGAAGDARRRRAPTGPGAAARGRAAGARTAAAPASIRSPSSASVGGQHGQRAEHGDGDDDDRAERHRR